MTPPFRPWASTMREGANGSWIFKRHCATEHLTSLLLSNVLSACLCVHVCVCKHDRLSLHCDVPLAFVACFTCPWGMARLSCLTWHVSTCSSRELKPMRITFRRQHPSPLRVSVCLAACRNVRRLLLFFLYFCSLGASGQFSLHQKQEYRVIISRNVVSFMFRRRFNCFLSIWLPFLGPLQLCEMMSLIWSSFVVRPFALFMYVWTQLNSGVIMCRIPRWTYLPVVTVSVGLCTCGIFAPSSQISYQDLPPVIPVVRSDYVASIFCTVSTERCSLQGGPKK